MKKYFELDNGSVSLDMLITMHPAIVLMISWTNFWCMSHGVTPVWTSWKRTPEQNKELGATSVHEYRAADLSHKQKWGWTPKLRKKFFTDFRLRFTELGAFVPRKGKGIGMTRRPIIRHDSGHGDHFHLQCAPHADVFEEAMFAELTIKKLRPNGRPRKVRR